MVLLLMLPIFSVIHSFWMKRKISVNISVKNEYINRGQNAVWDFNFKNLSKMQAIYIQIVARFPEIINKGKTLKAEVLIPQHSTRTIRISAKTAYSGPFNINDISVYANDIFGFFRIKLFSKDLEIPDIIVLPKEDSSSNYKKYLSNQLEAGEFPAGKSQILLDEIDRFRSMEPGDSLKLIHWKLSARMQDWIVKEFDKEDDRSVTVILNLPEIKFDSNQDLSNILKMRNFILDHAYTAMQIFLSNRATVRLKTYQPERVEEEAIHMDEIDLLKKQLAFIPFEKVVDFNEQLADEQYDNEQNLIYLLTYQVDDALIAQLKNLRAKIGAMLLVYVIDQEANMDLIQNQIKQLTTLGINVEIAKTHEVNVYE